MAVNGDNAPLSPKALPIFWESIKIRAKLKVIVAFLTIEKFLEKLMDIGNKNKTNIITDNAEAIL